MQKLISKLNKERESLDLFQYRHCFEKIKNLYNVSRQLAENPFDTCQKKRDAKDSLSELFTNFSAQLKDKFDNPNKCVVNFEPKGIIKYVKAYKCETCSIQNNSVICLDCFQKQKHPFHKYQLINVKGGCCDCGDSSMWKKQSFCAKHSTSQKQVQDSQKQVEELEEEKRLSYNFFLKNSLKILIIFYYSSKQAIYKVSNGSSNVELEKTDLFGSLLMDTLITLNVNNQNINKMTRDLLTSHIKLQSIPQIELKYLLLRFIELPQTSKKIVKLMMILFEESWELRKEITINYLKLYQQVPNYIRSNYNHFSAQILTNSNLISQLIHQVPFLSFQFLGQEDNLMQLQLLSEDIEIYFRDLGYLTCLRQQTSHKYWKKQIETQDFLKIAQCFQLINRYDENLQIYKKKYYYLQESFMKIWAKIVDACLNDPQLCQTALQKITKQVLKQIYDRKEVPFSFILHRMWGHLIFAYFYQLKKPIGLGHITIEEVQKATMIGKQQLFIFISKLAQKSIKNMHQVSQMMKSKEQKDKRQSFATTYFMPTKYSLFSIDAFLLRTSIILLTADDQYQNNGKNSQKLVGVLNQIFENYFFAIENTKKLNQKSKSKPKKLFFITQSLTLFINLCLQSLHSELVDLTLVSDHATMIQNSQVIREKYLNFYVTIFHSLKQQLSASQFRSLIQQTFFKETVSLEHFMYNYKHKFQIIKTIEEEPIDIQRYTSLMFKINNRNLRNKFRDHDNSTNLAYSSTCFGNRLLQTKFISIMEKLIYEVQQTESYKEILTDKIIKTLLRLCYLYNSVQFYQLLAQINFGSNLDNSCSSLNNSYFTSNQSNISISGSLQQIQSSSCTFDNLSKETQILQLIQSNEQERKQRFNLLFGQYYVGTCIFNQQCNKTSQNSELCLLAFVNYSKLYHDFSIKDCESSLIFVTCGHSAHIQCSELYSKKTKVKSCAVCNKNYNCLLKKRFQNKENLFGFSEISQEFQRIANALDESMYFNIEQSMFLSILVYLLKALVSNDQDFYPQTLLLYKDLFHKLRQYTNCKKQNNNSQQIFQFHLNTIRQNFGLNSLVSLAAQKLSKSICSDINFFKRQTQLYKKQNIYLETVISFFLESEITWNVPTPYNSSHKSTLFQNITRILPKTLSQIAYQTEIKCSCCKKQANLLCICLLHPVTNQLPEFSFCYSCFQKQVIKHMKQYHHSQILFLQTDSGRPTYLYVDNISQQPVGYFPTKNYRQNKFLYQMSSLYQNHFGKPYFPKEYQDKSKYRLSEKKVQDLANKMMTGTLSMLASNEYLYE